jgi:hypothetical protein
MTQPIPDGLPVVNLNGTELEQLLQQHWNVLKAARELGNALGMAAPHGRDYQTTHPKSLRVARDLWHMRITDTNAVREWAEDRLNDLMRQNIERNGDKAYEITARVMR